MSKLKLNKQKQKWLYLGGAAILTVSLLGTITIMNNSINHDSAKADFSSNPINNSASPFKTISTGNLNIGNDSSCGLKQNADGSVSQNLVVSTSGASSASLNLQCIPAGQTLTNGLPLQSNFPNLTFPPAQPFYPFNNNFYRGNNPNPGFNPFLSNAPKSYEECRQLVGGVTILTYPAICTYNGQTFTQPDPTNNPSNITQPTNYDQCRTLVGGVNTAVYPASCTYNGQTFTQ